MSGVFDRPVVVRRLNLDLERGHMDALSARIGEDGLAHSPLSDGGAPQGPAYPMANGLLALAMLNWHERDGDPGWLERFRRLTATLVKIAQSPQPATSGVIELEPAPVEV